jgi:hypothetical protein
MEVRDNEVGVVRLPVERHHGDHHAGEAAEGEDEEKAQDEIGRRLHLQLARRDRGDPREDLDAAWDRHRHAGRREEAERQLRDFGGEHVMHPQAEREEARSDERQHDEPVARERGLRHGGHHHGDHAGRRQEDDIDLRVAEEPEQVLP